MLADIERTADVSDAISRGIYRRAPFGDDVLIPFLHKFLRIDVAREGIHIVVFAVVPLKRKHLMQEITAFLIADTVEERCLPIIERLGKTAVNLMRRIRHGEGLRKIRLPGENIAVTELRVAEGDDLLDACHHLACDGRPVAALFILVVVCRLNGLCLEGLLNILHTGECVLRGVHPRKPCLHAALIPLVLALGDVVAQVTRIVHGVVGGTVQFAAVALLHEFGFIVFQFVEIFLIALYRVIAADADCHGSHLTFQPCRYY